MKNTKFKEALTNFFIKHWCSNEMISFVRNRLIHLNFRNCHSYPTIDNIIQSNVVEDLSCTLHEEADTKIIYYACSIADAVKYYH